MLAGDQHARVLRPQRDRRVGRGGQVETGRAGGPGGVLLDLGRDVVLGGAALIEVRVVPGVVDPAKGARVRLVRRGIGRLERGQERIAALSGRFRYAAAAVEQLVDAEVVLGRPVRRVDDIRGTFTQRRCGAVVRGVKCGVPAVVGEEVVVDVRIEIVTLITEVDPARRPRQGTVAQKL